MRKPSASTWPSPNASPGKVVAASPISTIAPQSKLMHMRQDFRPKELDRLERLVPRHGRKDKIEDSGSKLVPYPPDLGPHRVRAAHQQLAQLDALFDVPPRKTSALGLGVTAIVASTRGRVIERAVAGGEGVAP